MRRPIVLSLGLVLVLGTHGANTWVAAQADDCVRVPVVATTFEDVVVCAGEGEEANGTVAVSLRGPARASGPLRAAAVSGTGRADQSTVCVSGTGRAGGPHDPDSGLECGASAGIAGEDEGSESSSSAYLLAISGRGTAQAPVAVSVFGDANAQLVSVSGTGEASGQSYTGRHESPFVAVSGCRAEHADHDEEDNMQILTADPSRVHVLVDLEILFNPEKPPDEWEPTDVETGQVGQTVQNITCSVRP